MEKVSKKEKSISVAIKEHAIIHKEYDNRKSEGKVVDMLLLHAIISKKLSDFGIENDSPLQKVDIKKFEYITLPNPSTEWIVEDADTVSKIWDEYVSYMIANYGKAVVEYTDYGERVVVEKYGDRIAMYTNNTYINIIDVFDDIKKDLMMIEEDIILDCTVSTYGSYLTINDILFKDGSLLKTSTVDRKEVIKGILDKYAFSWIFGVYNRVISNKVEFAESINYGYKYMIKDNSYYPDEYNTNQWVMLIDGFYADFDIMDVSMSKSNKNSFVYKLGYKDGKDIKFIAETIDTNISVKKGDTVRCHVSNVDIHVSDDEKTIVIKSSPMLAIKKSYESAVSKDDIIRMSIDKNIYVSNNVDFIKKITVKKTLPKKKSKKKQIKCAKTTIYIKKVDIEKRIVTGVVLQPDIKDAQNHVITKETIEEACFDYMERGYKTNVNHGGEDYTDEIRIVENYIAPQNITINHELIKKGTWIMSVKINDPEIWEMVLSGELNGFSIEGIGSVTEA